MITEAQIRNPCFEQGCSHQVTLRHYPCLPKTVEFFLRCFERSSQDHQSLYQRHPIYFH